MGACFIALTSVWHNCVFPVRHSPWISVSILLSTPPPRILSNSFEPVETWYTIARSCSRHSDAVMKGDSPSTRPLAAVVSCDGEVVRETQRNRAHFENRTRIGQSNLFDLGVREALERKELLLSVAQMCMGECGRCLHDGMFLRVPWGGHGQWTGWCGTRPP
jgi:hypothetical protein